jgi:hypothetical protein
MVQMMVLRDMQPLSYQGRSAQDVKVCLIGTLVVWISRAKR